MSGYAIVGTQRKTKKSQPPRNFPMTTVPSPTGAVRSDSIEPDFRTSARRRIAITDGTMIMKIQKKTFVKRSETSAVLGTSAFASAKRTPRNVRLLTKRKPARTTYASGEKKYDRNSRFTMAESAL